MTMLNGLLTNGKDYIRFTMNNLIMHNYVKINKKTKSEESLHINCIQLILKENLKIDI